MQCPSANDHKPTEQIVSLELTLPSWVRKRSIKLVLLLLLFRLVESVCLQCKREHTLHSPMWQHNREAEMLWKDEARLSEPGNKHVQILSMLIAMGLLWFVVRYHHHLSPCQMPEILLYWISCDYTCFPFLWNLNLFLCPLCTAEAVYFG